MKIGRTLYFDHQATTPVDPRILAAMTPYFVDAFGNPHSADHVLGWEAARAVDAAAAKIAALVGADADEIIFTSGATEANNIALLGFARRAVAGRRRRILVSSIEHKSVLAVARVLQEQLGYRIELLSVDTAGRIVMPALEQALDDDVLAVSVMAVNNEIGTIQEIAEISRLACRVGAVLHCDCAQAPCATDVKTMAQLVHLLSLSSHKMYGPKGLGALVVRRELQHAIEPVIYGGGQQNNLRSGTVPVALCVGMGAAADILSTEAAQERESLRQRRDAFVDGLHRLRWPIDINGPDNIQRHPGNANVRFKGFSAHDILGALQPRLAASTGSACTSGMPEPSHVLRAIGLSTKDAQASIRFSLGRYTTDADVAEALGIIDETLTRLIRAGTANQVSQHTDPMAQ